MSEPEAVTSDGYLPDAKWSYGHVAGVFLSGLGGALVGLIVVAASGPVDVENLDPVAIFGVILPAQVAGSLLAAGVMSHRVGTGDWSRDFGLRLRVRDAWGLVAGVGLQIVALVIIALTITLTGTEIAPRQNVLDLAEESAGLTIVLAFVGSVILAPLVEEVLYRGMLLPRALRSMSRHVAVIFSGVVFALVHLVTDTDTLLLQPGLAVVGIVLGYAALRSRDLSLPLFLHAGFNLTAFVAAQLADDLDAALGWVSRLAG